MNTDKQAARGLADIEAYLYRESHLSTARRRVTAFTGQTPGLTHEQKRDIEVWYLEDQKHVARMVTRHIADSIGAAEEAHHARVARWLRRTLIAMIVVIAVIFVGTVACTVWVA
ncbi:hypothetical protein EDD93_7574 [Streptomyces sp. 840.1]|uniref:hypothetical protein n=1 Tax=Streptomyces sp. 840.1 TaxID=2485152 RepID=UPI000F46DBA5|nr:hypothetical protein [Streptomyces sp. 840.1]ROQ60151.1 hypothetical protein EDD93_7574 [Streptomyces sp. 840.1]